MPGIPLWTLCPFPPFRAPLCSQGAGSLQTECPGNASSFLMSRWWKTGREEREKFLCRPPRPYIQRDRCPYRKTGIWTQTLVEKCRVATMEPAAGGMPGVDCSRALGNSGLQCTGHHVSWGHPSPEVNTEVQTAKQSPRAPRERERGFPPTVDRSHLFLGNPGVAKTLTYASYHPLSQRLTEHVLGDILPDVWAAQIASGSAFEMLVG